MAMTELYDEDLYQAFGEIDTRKWGARLRIVAIVRREQRLSRDGVGRIGNHELARRAGITSQYAWKLTGTGKSSPGLMWRVEHVLEVVERGAGSRGTGYRIRPIDNWRGVPWIEEQREIRRLRSVDGRKRADDLAAAEGAQDASSRSVGATRAEMESRSYGATLDDVASRWRTRRYLKARAVPSQRDANPEPGALPPLVVVGDVPSPPPDRRNHDDDEVSSYLKAVKAAVYAKTESITWGRIDAQIRRLDAEGVELEWLTRAIGRAKAGMAVPAIFDRWIPFVRDNGIPDPPRLVPVVGVSAFVTDDELCGECRGKRVTVDDDGTLISCPACGSEAMSAPRGTMDTP